MSRVQSHNAHQQTPPSYAIAPVLTVLATHESPISQLRGHGAHIPFSEVPSRGDLRPHLAVRLGVRTAARVAAPARLLPVVTDVRAAKNLALFDGFLALVERFLSGGGEGQGSQGGDNGEDGLHFGRLFVVRAGGLV